MDRTQAKENIEEQAARDLLALLRRDGLFLRTALYRNLGAWGAAFGALDIGTEAALHHPGEVLRRFLKLPMPSGATHRSPLRDLWDLIFAHFWFVVIPAAQRRHDWIGIVPSEVNARWTEAGIHPPDAVFFGDHLLYAVTAGRALAERTDPPGRAQAADIAPLVAEANTARLDALLEEARDYSRNRLYELAERIALEDAAVNLQATATLLARATSDAVLETLREEARAIIAGSLHGEKSDAKALARRLRAKMKALDPHRDWERVATTEMRRALNLGRLVQLHERGWSAYVQAVLQPTACVYCKLLYLDENGKPKRFLLKDLLNSVFADGGMNKGRWASRIGTPDGWRPTAVTHPFCECFFVRADNQEPGDYARVGS